MDGTNFDIPNLLTGIYLVWIALSIVIIDVGIYILECTAFYKMFVKSKVKHPWLAYVPIANFWPFFRMIKKSAWNVLWIAGFLVVTPILVIPSAHAGNIILGVVIIAIAFIILMILEVLWLIRLFKAFNLSPWWGAAMFGVIIPFVSALAGILFIILFCYMGFSKNVHYNPNFDQKNPPPDNNLSV